MENLDRTASPNRMTTSFADRTRFPRDYACRAVADLRTFDGLALRDCASLGDHRRVLRSPRFDEISNSQD